MTARREADGAQEARDRGRGGSGAAAQQPAAGTVPAPSRAAVVAGYGPGRGGNAAAADLAAIPPGSQGHAGGTAARDGQAAALAFLLSRGHLAAAVGCVRS